MRQDTDEVLHQDAPGTVETVSQALALLAIKASTNTAHAQLKDYNGEIKLPPHFDMLLGRERIWTIKGPSGAEMAEALRKLLLLHTVGYWSRWPVLKSIEIVIPSSGADMHISDVAGFGDKLYDPYRQQIVTQTLKSSCSSMLLLLDHREGGGNATVRPYLQEAKVCECSLACCTGRSLNSLSGLVRG